MNTCIYVYAVYIWDAGAWQHRILSLDDAATISLGICITQHEAHPYDVKRENYSNWMCVPPGRVPASRSV